MQKRCWTAHCVRAKTNESKKFVLGVSNLIRCAVHKNTGKMNLSLSKIKKLDVGWNERPLTEADFFSLCRRFKITVEEMPLRVSGFYYFVMGRHFIAIDSKLPREKKLFVMFHEFAHFLLHVPQGNATADYHGVGRKTRKEKQADAFALCALIPKKHLASAEHNDLATEFAADLIRERLELFERYGI